MESARFFDPGSISPKGVWSEISQRLPDREVVITMPCVSKYFCQEPFSTIVDQRVVEIACEKKIKLVKGEEKKQFLAAYKKVCQLSGITIKKETPLRNLNSTIKEKLSNLVSNSWVYEELKNKDACSIYSFLLHGCSFNRIKDENGFWFSISPQNMETHRVYHSRHVWVTFDFFGLPCDVNCRFNGNEFFDKVMCKYLYKGRSLKAVGKIAQKLQDIGYNLEPELRILDKNSEEILQFIGFHKHPLSPEYLHYVFTDEKVFVTREVTLALIQKTDPEEMIQWKTLESAIDWGKDKEAILELLKLPLSITESALVDAIEGKLSRKVIIALIQKADLEEMIQWKILRKVIDWRSDEEIILELLKRPFPITEYELVKIIREGVYRDSPHSSLRKEISGNTFFLMLEKLEEEQIKEIDWEKCKRIYEEENCYFSKTNKCIVERLIQFQERKEQLIAYDQKYYHFAKERFGVEIKEGTPLCALKTEVDKQLSPLQKIAIAFAVKTYSQESSSKKIS